jgi:hypothetical protein
MITHDARWSLSRGKNPVPSPWQATFGDRLLNAGSQEKSYAHRATLTDIGAGRIRRKPVLGGLINEYTHAA